MEHGWFPRIIYLDYGERHFHTIYNSYRRCDTKYVTYCRRSPRFQAYDLRMCDEFFLSFLRKCMEFYWFSWLYIVVLRLRIPSTNFWQRRVVCTFWNKLRWGFPRSKIESFFFLPRSLRILSPSIVSGFGWNYRFFVSETRVAPAVLCCSCHRSATDKLFWCWNRSRPGWSRSVFRAKMRFRANNGLADRRPPSESIVVWFRYRETCTPAAGSGSRVPRAVYTVYLKLNQIKWNRESLNTNRLVNSNAELFTVKPHDVK